MAPGDTAQPPAGRRRLPPAGSGYLESEAASSDRAASVMATTAGWRRWRSAVMA